MFRQKIKPTAKRPYFLNDEGNIPLTKLYFNCNHAKNLTYYSIVKKIEKYWRVGRNVRHV